MIITELSDEHWLELRMLDMASLIDRRFVCFTTFEITMAIDFAAQFDSYGFDLFGNNLVLVTLHDRESYRINFYHFSSYIVMPSIVSHYTNKANNLSKAIGKGNLKYRSTKVAGFLNPQVK